jgi:hypothetical protein
MSSDFQYLRSSRKLDICLPRLSHFYSTVTKSTVVKFTYLPKITRRYKFYYPKLVVKLFGPILKHQTAAVLVLRYKIKNYYQQQDIPTEFHENTSVVSHERTGYFERGFSCCCGDIKNIKESLLQAWTSPGGSRKLSFPYY